ncbi:hypothetical protein FACS189497_10820 [Betaproteobacteria bacterium]|nr:hypothetical protein FACS189497_10820 [Betaproteobacteria bacterium]
MREARNGPNPTHKFYDIAALEIENGPNVPGFQENPHGLGSRSSDPGHPAPSKPLLVSVGDLASAINNDGINSYNMADMKPPRAAWGNFPDVQIHADESAVKQHPDYPAAKSGDAAAASRLVADTISDERVRAIKEMVGDVYPVLVSAHAYEANGVNAIPEALVDALASRLAWKLERNIVQTNVVGHTGANGFARLARQAAFDGDVQPGTQYFLVDDFVGQGGTLANLRGYIESRGGIVLGATSLTGKQFSAKLGLSRTQLDELRGKHGQELERWWQARFGHGFDRLTQSEARYLANSTDADAIRNRIAAAEQAGNSRRTDEGSVGISTQR